LCLKKPNKMIERSESSLNNPENNCHSQNNQKNQLHFFWKSTLPLIFEISIQQGQVSASLGTCDKSVLSRILTEKPNTSCHFRQYSSSHENQYIKW
ncbi:MAG: hypothetical protein WA081_13540, partial [Desulfosalsimonadaceae bacterium]